MIELEKEKISRDEILNAIRHATDNIGVPERPEIPTPVGKKAKKTLHQQFCDMLEKVGGETRVITGKKTIDSVLKEILKEFKGETVLLNSDPELERLSIPEIVKDTGIVLLQTSEGTLDELSKSQVGITTAQAGIADTGTVILLHTGERGRLAALLPEVHIVLLKKTNLHADKSSAIAVLKSGNVHPGDIPMTWVTGPSLTADIEKVLVRGAHGPKRLIAILY
ncbi:hypothetical protein CEE37_06620 [candidate division LCP-89 bacterium B3_LCP]|uniref:LUD domain-containing protein n=1 Tax=candidate division LCP-89 bacterium B3_LCP TaxID=2012998 RepID=A0A532V095_UNCL8|nr:MAG: hypothetical protein CEE37_06620 [candidate division LCP-89 bacterium B3_LCP]